jgi:hypothetical protein
MVVIGANRGSSTRRGRRLAVGGVLLGAALLGACRDDEGGEDLEATCALLEAISSSEEIGEGTFTQLDELIEVAPDDIASDIRIVRDGFADQGEAAFDDPAVVEAFESVGAFEGEECTSG